jgi:hypothetical protein
MHPYNEHCKQHSDDLKYDGTYQQHRKKHVHALASHLGFFQTDECTKGFRVACRLELWQVGKAEAH